MFSRRQEDIRRLRTRHMPTREIKPKKGVYNRKKEKRSWKGEMS